MICCDCGNGRHESCPGGTWCCCAHRTDRRPVCGGIAGVAHAEHDEWDALVRRQTEANQPPTCAEPVEEDTPWTDAQEAEYQRLDSLSLECQHRVCGGCDGLKWGPGNTPCAHDCHSSTEGSTR